LELRETRFLHAGFHFAFLEGADHVGDVTVDKGGEVIDGQVDAVIGDAVLGIVVGADFFLASAAADEAAAVGGVFGGLLLLFALEEAGAENG